MYVDVSSLQSPNIGGLVDVLCTVSMILLMVRKSTISRMNEKVHKTSTQTTIFGGWKEETSTYMKVKEFCQSDHCVKCYWLTKKGA
jgi:hypothetical protein